MKIRNGSVLLAPVLLFVIACSNSEPAQSGGSSAAGAGSSGGGASSSGGAGGSSTGTSSGTGSGAGSSSGILGTSGGTSSGTGDGGQLPDDGSADGGGFSPPAAACIRTASWGVGMPSGVSGSAIATFDAVTPDELTIAWTAGSGASAAIYVADRASTTDPFGTPQAVSAAAFAPDRAALSPDGLRLIVVDAGRQGFSELTRTSRSPAGSFGPPTTGSYANFDSPGALPAGQALGDPVLDAYDETFYYSQYSVQPPEAGTSSQTVYVTGRLLPSDVWPLGAPLPLDSSMSLAQQGGLRRRPTGVSSDQQTLFFWDEVSGTERSAWINASTGVFDAFADLGSRAMAAPNFACTRIYYSAPAAGSGNDIFLAAAQ